MTHARKCGTAHEHQSFTHTRFVHVTPRPPESESTPGEGTHSLPRRGVLPTNLLHLHFRSPLFFTSADVNGPFEKKKRGEERGGEKSERDISSGSPRLIDEHATQRGLVGSCRRIADPLAQLRDREFGGYLVGCDQVRRVPHESQAQITLRPLGRQICGLEPAPQLGGGVVPSKLSHWRFGRWVGHCLYVFGTKLAGRLCRGRIIFCATRHRFRGAHNEDRRRVPLR